MYTNSGSALPVMQLVPTFFPGLEECAWNAAAAVPVYDASEGTWATMSTEQGQLCIGECLQQLGGDACKSLPETTLGVYSSNVEHCSDKANKRRRRVRRNRHHRGQVVATRGGQLPRSDASDVNTSEAEDSINLNSADLSAFPPLPQTKVTTSGMSQCHQAGARGCRSESAPDTSHLTPTELHSASSEAGAQASPSDHGLSHVDKTNTLKSAEDVQAGKALTCPLGSACSVKQLGESEELCTEFGARLGRDTVEQEDAIVEWIVHDVLELALSQFGCRLVQKLLDTLGNVGRDRLVAKLAPSTVSLYESPYGNHVLTKVIQVMPSAALTTIIEQVECKGYWEVARHSFGCRVLERLIENCKEDQMRGVIDRLVGSAEELCRHKFGNFVIQHLLEHGEEHRRAAVVERLLPRIAYLSMHRTACHVVQRALNYGGAEGQMAIVRALLNAQGSNNLAVVAASRYGSYVVEELAHLRCTWVVDEVRRHLTEAPLHLHRSAAFKRVATAYGLSLPCESGNTNEDKP